MKKLISFVLSFVMLSCVLCLNVFADTYVPEVIPKENIVLRDSISVAGHNSIDLITANIVAYKVEDIDYVRIDMYSICTYVHSYDGVVGDIIVNDYIFNLFDSGDYQKICGAQGKSTFFNCVENFVDIENVAYKFTACNFGDSYTNKLIYYMLFQVNSEYTGCEQTMTVFGKDIVIPFGTESPKTVDNEYVKQLESENQRLTEENNALKTNVSVLEKALKDANATIANLKKSYAELEKVAAGLIESVNAKLEEIRNIRDRMTDITGDGNVNVGDSVIYMRYMATRPILMMNGKYYAPYEWYDAGMPYADEPQTDSEQPQK